MVCINLFIYLFSEYSIQNGFPVNPVARTGLVGRGDLYQWGPSTGVGATLWTLNKNEEIEFVAVRMGKHEETKCKLIIYFKNFYIEKLTV